MRGGVEREQLQAAPLGVVAAGYRQLQIDQRHLWSLRWRPSAGGVFARRRIRVAPQRHLRQARRRGVWLLYSASVAQRGPRYRRTDSRKMRGHAAESGGE